MVTRLTGLLLILLLLLSGLPLVAQDTDPLPETMYVRKGRTAPAFACAEEDCERLALLPAGAGVTVIGGVEGRELKRSPLWYEVLLNCPCFDYESRQLSGDPATDEEGYMRSWFPYWSPDGSRIATVIYNKLYIWDAGSGELLVTEALNPFTPSDMAWSPDGTRIVVSGYVYPNDAPEQNLLLLDADGQSRTSLEGQAGQISAVAWSHDGTRIVAAGTETRIWDALEGTSLLAIGTSSTVVDWSPDDTRIVTGGGQQVELHVWDAASGALLDTLERAGPAHHVVWSPDGARIAYAGHSGERPYGALYIWDTNRRERSASLAESSWGLDVSWSPDGRFLAATVDSVVSILDAADGRKLASLTTREDFVGGFLGHVAWAQDWSPDGSQIAASGIGNGEDVAAWIWDVTLVLEAPPRVWIHSSYLTETEPSTS